MKFKARFAVYALRYYSAPIIILCSLLRSIPKLMETYKGYEFGEAFKIWSDAGSSNPDRVKIWIFLAFLALACQVVCYFVTQSSTKLIVIGKSSITITTFNKKVTMLKYSQIKSLEYTQDRFRNFLFILKSGENKVVFSAIKNPSQAFDLMYERLENNRKK